MNILDFVKDSLKEADAFENHPLKSYSLEEQLLYLNVLSLVMFVDETVTTEEKTYLSILIKSFSLDADVLDSLIEFAEQPDKQTFHEFIQFFRRKPIAQLFLFDAYMLASSSQSFSDDARLLISQLADGLEILKGTQKDIFDLFCHIKNKDWQESALYFSSHLLASEHFQHLLEYHGVNFDELIKKTEGLRVDRLLKIMKNKMQSEDLKPTIDNTLILPALQAEISRGNAVVTADKITIINNRYIKDLALSEIAISFDNGSKTFKVINPSEVESPLYIKYFIETLGIHDINGFIKTLYNVDNAIPTGMMSTINNQCIILDFGISEHLPFVIVDTRLFRCSTRNLVNGFISFGMKRPFNRTKLYLSENKQLLLGGVYELQANKDDCSYQGELTLVETDEAIDFILKQGASSLKGDLKLSNRTTEWI